MVALPELGRILDLALNPVAELPALENCVCFPIYREDQFVRLKQVLDRKGLEPLDAEHTVSGLRLRFGSDDDAILAKMSFNVA